MYQGTSLWIWAVQGFLWLCVAALVVAIGLVLLAGAALVGLGWLAWQGWLALRDRRNPPVPSGPFDHWRTLDQGVGDPAVPRREARGSVLYFGLLARDRWSFWVAGAIIRRVPPQGGPVRRRLLFMTALAITLVAGAATTANRPAEAEVEGNAAAGRGEGQASASENRGLARPTRFATEAGAAHHRSAVGRSRSPTPGPRRLIRRPARSPAETGVVTEVLMSLDGLSHTYPDDVDVLLVGPGGQDALVMSDVGGSSDVMHLTIGLDDAAGSPLPN